MLHTNLYLRLATLGLFISPIVSFPQDAIQFGGARDDVKVPTGSSYLLHYICSNINNKMIKHKQPVIKIPFKIS